jgi:hypothetical protein
MGTYRKSLATLRRLVEERGEYLRRLPFERLKQFATKPVEHITVESRPATISIIVLTLPSGGLQIVVQGSLKHRYMPGESLALDGFCKYPDETLAPMEKDEFWDSVSRKVMVCRVLCSDNHFIVKIPHFFRHSLKFAFQAVVERPAHDAGDYLLHGLPRMLS